MSKQAYCTPFSCSKFAEFKTIITVYTIRHANWDTSSLLQTFSQNINTMLNFMLMNSISNLAFCFIKHQTWHNRVDGISHMAANQDKLKRRNKQTDNLKTSTKISNRILHAWKFQHKLRRITRLQCKQWITLQHRACSLEQTSSQCGWHRGDNQPLACAFKITVVFTQSLAKESTDWLRTGELQSSFLITLVYKSLTST